MSAFDIREAPPTAAASGYRCDLSAGLAHHIGRPAPCGTADDVLTVCPLGEEDPKHVRDPARCSRAGQLPRLGGPRELISQADYNTSVWRRQASPSRRIRRGLAGAEVTELAGGGGPRALQGLHLGPAGAL